MAGRRSHNATATCWRPAATTQHVRLATAAGEHISWRRRQPTNEAVGITGTKGKSTYQRELAGRFCWSERKSRKVINVLSERGLLENPAEAHRRWRSTLSWKRNKHTKPKTPPGS